MCFSSPKIPAAPPVPSKEADAARARRASIIEQTNRAQGTASTVISSPLGDPEYGKNVNRTTLGSR